MSSAKVYRGFNLSYFALFLLDNHVNRMINTINIFVSSFIISPRQNDFNLVLEDFSDQLKPQEAQWLRLHIQGFKQYEIAQHMNLSLTSIKKIKNSTKQKCLNNLK